MFCWRCHIFLKSILRNHYIFVNAKCENKKYGEFQVWFAKVGRAGREANRAGGQVLVGRCKGWHAMDVVWLAVRASCRRARQHGEGRGHYILDAVFDLVYLAMQHCA